jgi:hypothetical protein
LAGFDMGILKPMKANASGAEQTGEVEVLNKRYHGLCS